MISPKGSISDKKILEKPAQEQNKGILSHITGKGCLFYLIFIIFSLNLTNFTKVANHFRSFSMIDSNKLKRLNDNKGNPNDKNDNCLITLASVPEREHEKDEDFKFSRNFNKIFKCLSVNLFILQKLINIWLI